MHMSWPIDRPAVATPQRQSRLREFLESVSKSAQLNRKIGRGVLAAMGVLGIGFGAIATSSDNSHSDFRIPAVESPWEQPAETDYNTDAGTPIINPTTPLIMPKEPAPFAERPIAPTASNIRFTASVPETIKTPEIDLVISKLINDPSVMPYTLLEELGVPSDDRVYALNATIAAYAKEHKVLFVLCADGIIREVGTDRIISPEKNKLLKEFMYLDLL